MGECIGRALNPDVYNQVKLPLHQGSPEKQNHQDVYIYALREREKQRVILRNWLGESKI